ncbi:hypothetical protein M404DRAFT_10623 [Pisolithus tinctorius Marx 270]|uniref:Uncharacterized protein n=1 Tax=Pisolithus tinctorius Marx 270 TaxID=870435 RepID=A0A0C3IMQ6_PISTI|nr:hypothetical protein M404DRAFT_10623 [Pisolithus tinctorius Marx 270]
MAESQSDDRQPSGDEDALHVAHCRSKRQIAALELELETMRASSKKSRRQQDSYVHQGRAIRRLVTLYENVEDLITVFDRHQEFQENDHNESDLENTCDDDRLYKSFEELITVLPWMKKIILHSTADELEDICKQLQKGADGARGDDTANLKQDIVSWLTDLFHPIEPPLRTTTKDERGFMHDVTGKLICPAEFDWDLAIHSSVNCIHGSPDLPGPAAKKRVDELLAWWNRKAFGKNQPITLPAAAVKKLSVSQLAAQRLAKEME